MDAWRSGEKRKDVVNIASGRETSKAGRSEVKRRSDVIVEGALERQLLITPMPRIAPEVERAYAFDKEWGIEKFRICCYETENAGFFRPHRDNPSEALSHRPASALGGSRKSSIHKVIPAHGARAPYRRKG